MFEIRVLFIEEKVFFFEKRYIKRKKVEREISAN